MLEAIKISKHYLNSLGIKVSILNDISFTLKDGSLTSILASKKSGKTTLLKIIAGLESASSGYIKNTSSKKNIFIPQLPSSFPWLNVFENVVFGLTDFKDAEVKKIIQLVGLGGYEYSHPQNKSIGFRFRISLARSLANKPDVVLIDDSFHGMDIQTRNELFSLIKEINKKYKQTFLFATSSSTEAILLSDTILLLEKNPAEIIKEIKNDLSKKKELSSTSSKKFIQLKNEIFDTFKKFDY